MQLHIFARFHAQPGNEATVEQALQQVVPPTRAEPGCVEINIFRSVRDPRLFYLQSRWQDEAAFDHHAQLPHTVRFISTVEPLIDHPLDVNRAVQIG